MKILVPVDFSGNSMHAAEQAILWAEKRSAEVSFLYVSQVLSPTGSVMYGVPVETEAEHLAARSAELKEETGKIFTTLGVQPDPGRYTWKAVNNAVNSTGIVEYAQSWGADIIVMGNRGESNLSTMLLGRTTTAVLDKSEIPVCTIPAGNTRADWRNVAIGTDLVTVEQDIALAAPFIGRLDDKFDLVYVSPVFPEKVDMSQFSPQKLLAALHEQTGLAFNWVNVVTEEENDITGGLQQYVEKHNPDLLVMFYTRRNWFEKLIDASYTKQMLFNNRVAVLSFKRSPKIAGV